MGGAGRLSHRPGGLGGGVPELEPALVGADLVTLEGERPAAGELQTPTRGGGIRPCLPAARRRRHGPCFKLHLGPPCRSSVPRSIAPAEAPKRRPLGERSTPPSPGGSDQMVSGIPGTVHPAAARHRNLSSVTRLVPRIEPDISASLSSIRLICGASVVASGTNRSTPVRVAASNTRPISTTGSPFSIRLQRAPGDTDAFREILLGHAPPFPGEPDLLADERRTRKLDRKSPRRAHRDEPRPGVRGGERPSGLSLEPRAPERRMRRRLRRASRRGLRCHRAPEQGTRRGCRRGPTSALWHFPGTP